MPVYNAVLFEFLKIIGINFCVLTWMQITLYSLNLYILCSVYDKSEVSPNLHSGILFLNCWKIYFIPVGESLRLLWLSEGGVNLIFFCLFKLTHFVCCHCNILQFLYFSPLCFRLEGRTGVMLWTLPSTGWQRRLETFADRLVFFLI